MRLSEAIRLGSMLKPQGFAIDYRTTCAIQAALEAIGKVGTPYAFVMDHWPWVSREETNPVSGEVTRVWSIIRELNDDRGWTREQIADWVESLERAQEQPSDVSAARDADPVGVPTVR
jgi:hypothetical protein